MLVVIYDECFVFIVLKVIIDDFELYLVDWEVNGIFFLCLWIGVDCNNLLLVVGLYLFGMNFLGIIFFELGNLKNLVNLFFDCNNFIEDLFVDIVIFI